MEDANVQFISKIFKTLGAHPTLSELELDTNHCWSANRIKGFKDLIEHSPALKKITVKNLIDKPDGLICDLADGFHNAKHSKIDTLVLNDITLSYGNTRTRLLQIIAGEKLHHDASASVLRTLDLSNCKGICSYHSCFKQFFDALLKNKVLRAVNMAGALRNSPNELAALEDTNRILARDDIFKQHVEPLRANKAKSISLAFHGMPLKSFNDSIVQEFMTFFTNNTSLEELTVEINSSLAETSLILVQALKDKPNLRKLSFEIGEWGQQETIYQLLVVLAKQVDLKNLEELIFISGYNKVVPANYSNMDQSDKINIALTTVLVKCEKLSTLNLIGLHGEMESLLLLSDVHQSSRFCLVEQIKKMELQHLNVSHMPGGIFTVLDFFCLPIEKQTGGKLFAAQELCARKNAFAKFKLTFYEADGLRSDFEPAVDETFLKQFLQKLQLG